jgi:hypothetical protein
LAKLFAKGCSPARVVEFGVEMLVPRARVIEGSAKKSLVRIPSFFGGVSKPLSPDEVASQGAAPAGFVEVAATITPRAVCGSRGEVGGLTGKEHIVLGVPINSLTLLSEFSERLG